MPIFGPFNSGAAVGADGAATINKDTNIRFCGRMAGIYIKYNGDKPATNDVIIKTTGTNAPSITFLTLTNKNTDGWFFPRMIPDDLLGVDLAALAIAEPIPFDDFVNISLAQSNTDDSIDVYLLVE